MDDEYTPEKLQELLDILITPETMKMPVIILLNNRDNETILKDYGISTATHFNEHRPRIFITGIMGGGTYGNRPRCFFLPTLNDEIKQHYLGAKLINKFKSKGAGLPDSQFDINYQYYICGFEDLFDQLMISYDDSNQVKFSQVHTDTENIKNAIKYYIQVLKSTPSGCSDMFSALWGVLPFMFGLYTRDEISFNDHVKAKFKQTDDNIYDSDGKIIATFPSSTDIIYPNKVYELYVNLSSSILSQENKGIILPMVII